MDTILIPLISKKENNQEFLDKAIDKVKEVTLLLVVDTASMPREFGFGAMEISDGRKLMDEVKQAIGKKRKKALDIIQWGDTFNKIDNTAKLKQIKTITFLKEDNEYYKELIKKLKNQKSYKIEEIEITKPKIEDE